MQNQILIIGAGAAGLIAALKLAAGENAPKVIVAVKAPLGKGSSSVLAQGGVAASMGADDTPAQHAQDTLKTSGGLGEKHPVDLLTGAAPQAIEELRDLGVKFDIDEEGGLVIGQEAAHSRRRILHSGGDATGAEIIRVLKQAVLASQAIEVVEGAEALDLLVEEGKVCGALFCIKGELETIPASAVVLATGGLGALYQFTTNPEEARGDGLAMAARAGAEMADMEFVQFHPTAMDIGGDPLPLATEALRGEGAKLLNSQGVRFMPAVHEDAELAPRDVVARAIWRQRQMGQKTYLDCREAIGPDFAKRFPTVYAYCRDAGIDPVSELIPIVPAAHYHMGGIRVDEDGRSSVPGLWACGEVASTGVHGANRLASNSLLEAIVFAPRTAKALSETGLEMPIVAGPEHEDLASPTNGKDWAKKLRQLAYDSFGLVRDEKGMKHALREISELEKNLPAVGGLRNRATVLKLIGISALNRLESRGGHFRSDYPEPKKAYERRSFITLDEANQQLLRIDLDEGPYGKKQA